MAIIPEQKTPVTDETPVLPVADAPEQEAPEVEKSKQYVVLSQLGNYTHGDVLDVEDIELRGTKNNTARLLRLGVIAEVESGPGQAALAMAQQREEARRRDL